MAHVVMAHVVMACGGMACIVMALCGYDPSSPFTLPPWQASNDNSCGVACSRGLDGYGSYVVMALMYLWHFWQALYRLCIGSVSALYRLCIGIAAGMSIVRV